MRIITNIEPKPWPVPNFVYINSPQGGSIPLTSLSDDELESMCAEFRRGVFDKVGRVAPAITCGPHPDTERLDTLAKQPRYTYECYPNNVCRLKLCDTGEFLKISIEPTDNNLREIVDRYI